MGKISCLLIVGLLAGMMLLTQPTKSVAAETVDLKTSARTFVETLAREDFAAAVKSFGQPLDSSLPPEELRKTWTMIIAKGGPFVKIAGIETGRGEEYGGQRYDVVLVHCELAHAKMDVRLSFNRTAQITSLWFVPPEKNN
jgi:hypothetical protein